ncbi:Uncharacterized protein TPAR_02843 [Tolypocladium paradoxum]|uniref:Uncharacterized protein n=1 Tax=Tolypocladium paradoxum TaxID=94208 RepID=A0A2S4L3F1_9HYPO|nr:Uncharacterized protein TPAR_02843 [Tolypocladium paradoxum]
MPASKMAVFTSVMTLVGAFAAGVLGVAPNAPYSNGVSTETAAPQELGSTTSAGSLVYSLNVCTIVHSTNCAVSMSTGGAAPPAGQASTGPAAPGSESGYPTGKALATPGGSAASAGEPVPTVLTTTNSAGNPTVVTQVESSALATGKTTESAPAQSKQQQPSGSTGTPVPTSTGASNAVGVVRGVALAAAAMALAFLF